MAGEATIGALRVILGADAAKLEDNLRGALDSLRSFAASAVKIAAGINLADIFKQGAEELKKQFTDAIELGDKLSKASEKFGIPVETLSSLSVAADLSGVSLEQLGTSFSKLSKNMIASQGVTSEQARAFQALGVSVKDNITGQFKTADQVLLQVADSFAKFEDGPIKTALAIAIFGKAGADMISLLDKGSAAIIEIQTHLKDLGLIIDSKTAKAAEKLNDDWQFFHDVTTRLILKLAGSSGLIGSLDQLVKGLTDASKFGGDFSNTIFDIFKNLSQLATILAAAAQAATILGDTLNTVSQALTLVAHGEFTKAGELISKNFEEAQKRAAGLADTIGGLVPTVSEGMLGAAAASDTLNESLQRGKPPAFLDQQTAQQLEAFRKHIEQLNGSAIDASGIFAGRLAPGFLQAAAGMEILKGQVKLGADGVAELGLKAEQLNQAMLRLQGAKIVADSLPVWDQFNLKLKESEAALRAWGATDEQMLANHVKLSGESAAATGQFFSFLQQGAAAAGQSNKEFAFLAKQLAVVQATINTYEAATKAFNLFGGWPLGAAAAAATVAAGLALVAKIEAQPVARGGSFKVPGGISGVDTHMIPLALSSGERVDITPSSQVRDRGGRSREIVLRGIAPDEFFTGDMLRGLVDSLNQAHRDGYRLRVAER